HIVGADALVLLSDVDGVYDDDPRSPAASMLDEVHGVADLGGVRVAKPGTGSVGTGGMGSQAAAAGPPSGAGVPVLVAAASSASAALATTGAEVGTVFAPTGPRLSARRFWLRHTAG